MPFPTVSVLPILAPFLELLDAFFLGVLPPLELSPFFTLFALRVSILFFQIATFLYLTLEEAGSHASIGKERRLYFELAGLRHGNTK